MGWNGESKRERRERGREKERERGTEPRCLENQGDSWHCAKMGAQKQCGAFARSLFVFVFCPAAS